jgi:hypothetical protein
MGQRSSWPGTHFPSTPHPTAGPCPVTPIAPAHNWVVIGRPRPPVPAALRGPGAACRVIQLERVAQLVRIQSRRGSLHSAPAAQIPSSQLTCKRFSAGGQGLCLPISLRVADERPEQLRNEIDATPVEWFLLNFPLMKASAAKGKITRPGPSRSCDRASHVRAPGPARAAGPSPSYLQTRVRASRLLQQLTSWRSLS